MYECIAESIYLYTIKMSGRKPSIESKDFDNKRMNDTKAHTDGSECTAKGARKEFHGIACEKQIRDEQKEWYENWKNEKKRNGKRLS